jgi:hypothetical protein
MNQLLSSILTGVLLTGVSVAPSAAQPNGGSASQNAAQGAGVQLLPGTIIRVELAKSVEAKKAQVGDEVMARTLDDLLSNNKDGLAPKGCKVLGHVVEVSPRQGDSASVLGIAFDKMVLKNGTEVPLKASVQAIGTPESSTVAGNYEPMGGTGNGGGISPMPSGGRGGYGAPAPDTSMPGNVSATGTASPAADSATAIHGQLSPSAQGVVGMSGVSLSTGASQDSRLSSQKHNVKLDSGTQMILRVIP